MHDGGGGFSGGGGHHDGGSFGGGHHGGHHGGGHRGDVSQGLPYVGTDSRPGRAAPRAGAMFFVIALIIVGVAIAIAVH